MVRWILSAGSLGAEVRRRGDGEPSLLSFSERPGARGYGNPRQREDSGSDSASPAWPGEGWWVVRAAVLRGSFRFLPSLGHYFLGQLAEFAPPVPSVLQFQAAQSGPSCSVWERRGNRDLTSQLHCTAREDLIPGFGFQDSIHFICGSV